MGGLSRRFLCLFRRETRKRIFGPEISPYPEVVRGRERGLAGQRSWESSWWLDSKESWRGTTDRGSQHGTPETVAEKRGSSHSEEDRLKMSAFELLVEFSLVTHASASPHMHVVLHNSSFCYWVNPKHCSCLFVCPSIFSVPSIVFLCR